MVQLGSPGVYIVEASSGVRPIAAVSTSVAAFIDYFSEGPTDRAVQIFGLADFERVFGGLNKDSEASYAISQFFLNGGASAWVVRVSGNGSAGSEAKTAALPVGSTTLFEVKAANPGAWGENVRLQVTHNGDNSSGPGTFTLSVTRYSSPGSNVASRTERYLGLKLDDLQNVHETLNGSSQLIQTTSPPPSIPNINDAYQLTNGTLGAEITDFDDTLDDPTSGLGVSGNKTFVIDIGTGSSSHSERLATIPNWDATTRPQNLRELRTLVEGAVRGAKPTAGDSHDDWDAAFAGATVELVGKRLLVRSNPRAPTYNPKEKVTITADSSSTANTQLGFGSALSNFQEYGLENGKDGLPPGADAIVAGLALLDRVDLFNLLSVPRAAELGDIELKAAYSALLGYAQRRRAVLFVDVPRKVSDPVKAQDWLAANDSLRDKNSVIYFPRLEIPDPKNGFRPRSVGPSGTLAGLYSRTDTERGVWKAPAGVDARIRGATKLTYELTDGENGVLNPLAINALRNFPIYGQIAWGARTLDGADVAGSEWKYIPVRRLALMIEESLFRGTKWVVFEPNDEPLWARIRQNVGAFMLNLFRQGAFQGSTPKEAFYVKCDSETTTANDRNLGVVNIQVGFAPLKPAEFVVITIQQIPDVVA